MDGKPDGDGITGRRVLMWNGDVEISLGRPSGTMDYFFRNGEGDEVIFVHEGSGTLETIFGDLPYGEGDYIVIPLGTTYRFLAQGPQRRAETPLGTLYVTVTEDDKGQPFEVFMSLGKAGGALMADVEALGRLISLALRSGIPMKELHRQLRGLSPHRAIGPRPPNALPVPPAAGGSPRGSAPAI